MCTVVILRRPGHDWPLVLAANRDEMRARPWRSPARHWDDRPNVVAGLDELAGGSWLGMNDEGVVAGVMNRVDSLGPAPGRRSRGELVLEALDHAEARVAARALADLNPEAYRSFNLIVADAREAFWLRHLGTDGPGRIEVMPLPEGLSMLTAHDLNDARSARIRNFLPRFRQARAPDPGADDWSQWPQLLGERAFDPADGPPGAMSFMTEGGFGTVCGALIALPAAGRFDLKPVWRFAAGPPDRTPFGPVRL